MKAMNIFKYKVQHRLERQGFSVAPIADSTFPVDLIAIRNGETRGYRCKAHGKIYKPELQILRKLAQKLKVRIYIAKENGAREIVIWDAEAYSQAN